jgi:hypothetical protein
MTMTHAEALAAEAEDYRRKLLARIHELTAYTTHCREAVDAGRPFDSHILVVKAKAAEEGMEIWRAAVHAAKKAAVS